MFGLFLFVLFAAIVLAFLIGAFVGRVTHYARGFEAGLRHTTRALRAAIIEGGRP